MSHNSSGDYFGVDHLEAFKFFFEGLRDVVPESVRSEDVKYPASILAHYTQVSCFATQGFPTPNSLRSFHVNFLDKQSSVSVFSDSQSEHYEMVGTQCLLHSGFFSMQRHNMRSLAWYTEAGVRLFRLASQVTVDRERNAKMGKMADQFDMWQTAYHQLSVHLAGNMYLLRF